jgi:hypothetical protein
VGQTGHTSDFEEDLAGDEGRILGVETAETLENEGRNKFHAGQYRGSGIEQRPVTEIAMRSGHDGGPRRPRCCKNTYQSSGTISVAPFSTMTS